MHTPPFQDYMACIYKADWQGVAELMLGSARKPFIGSVVMFLASLTGLAVSIYPDVVPGQLTLAQAASGESTLVFMLFGVGMLLPVMLGYNIYQYLVFRGVIEPAKST